MIKKAGKEDIGGAEIGKSFPGVGQNIKALVETNAGVKVKTTGQEVSMRYQGGVIEAAMLVGFARPSFGSQFRVQ
jgi:hypothetical protein